MSDSKISTAIQKKIRRSVANSKEKSTRKNRSQKRLSYLFWICNHYKKYSPIHSYLDEAKSDIVSIGCALSLNLERTIYLHARSLIENLVRHCYYDSHFSTFVSEHSILGNPPRRRFGELLKQLDSLVCFRTAICFKNENDMSVTDDNGANMENKEHEGFDLWNLLRRSYRAASNFIHSPTVNEKSDYFSLQTLDICDERMDIIFEFISTLYASCTGLMFLYHIGAYISIPQPIRKYIIDCLSKKERNSLIVSFNFLPIDWITLQKQVAMSVNKRSSQKILRMREGLVRLSDGKTYILAPPLSSGKNRE